MAKTKARRNTDLAPRDTDLAPIVRFTPEESAARLERQAQREMGISVAEFRRAYAAGELEDGDAAVDYLVHRLVIPYSGNEASAPAQPDASAPAGQRDRLRELRSELIAEGAEPGRHLPELERRASTWPATPGRRRNFLLDSGAFLSFSLNPNLLVDYIDLLDRFDGSFLIPSGALVEVHTGEPGRDAFVRRLVDAIISGREDGYVPLTAELAKRAGALLYQVRQSNAPIDPIDAPIDAQVVVCAEYLSAYTAVTILTTDPEEIGELVEVTERTNIVIDVPG